LAGKDQQVTMGLDLQPDGLTAGLAGHCQLEKISSLRKKKRVCLKRKNCQPFLRWLTLQI